MFSNALQAFEAYFSMDFEQHNTALLYIEKEENNILNLAKSLNIEEVENIINQYLENFSMPHVVSIFFEREFGLFSLQMLISNNFDELRSMPFDYIFPLIEKAKIIAQNNINKTIEYSDDKSHFLENCTNLKALVLEDNKASCFYNLKTLLSLEIHSQYPIQIRKEIKQIKNLQHLKVVSSYYTKFCAELAELKALKSVEYYVFNSVIGSNILDLFRDTLQHNLSYLAACSNLEQLSISLDEYIKSLPELGEMISLRTLNIYNISHNFFYILPTLLEGNSQLEKLSTYLDVIPRNTSKLDETIALLNSKYDFYFETERNPYENKKYISPGDIYY